MKHPRSHEPQWCPCGSGVMQLLWLLKSGCERGLKGRGAWTVPADHAAAGCAGLSPVLLPSSQPRAPDMGTEPKAPDPAGDSPSLQQDRPHPGSSGDVTSTAAATHPGWLIFSKSQLISLGFSDTTD